MDFTTGVPSSSRSKSKSEVLQRAKEARAARADGGNAATRHTAAARIGRCIRSLLARRRVRSSLRESFAVPPGVHGPGVLVPLVSRYLFIARRDTAKAGSEGAGAQALLGPLCASLLASLDRTDGRATYAHALRDPDYLGPLWLAQVGPLLAAVVRLLEGAATSPPGGCPPPPTSATSAEAARRWGIPLRLALVLCEPAKWELAKEGADVAAAAAVVDGEVRRLAAEGYLPRAVAALCLAYNQSPLCAPVLTGAISLAVRPVVRHADARGGNTAATAAEWAAYAHFARHLLAVPALVDRAAADLQPALAGRVHAACVLSLASAGGRGAMQSGLHTLPGGQALAVVANAVALAARLGGRKAVVPAQVAAALEGGGRSAFASAAADAFYALRAAMLGAMRGGGVGLDAGAGAEGDVAASKGAEAGAGAGTGAGEAKMSSQSFHPFLGWVRAFDEGACRAHATAVEAQLRLLSLHAVVDFSFGPFLAGPLRVQPGAAAHTHIPAPTSGAGTGTGVAGEEQHALERLSSAAGAARFFLVAVATLPQRRTEILSTLAFSSLLLSRLWSALEAALPAVARASEGGFAALLRVRPSADDSSAAAALRTLDIFARSMALLLPTLEESELDLAPVDDDGVCRRFSRADLARMVEVLNPMAWECAASGALASAQGQLSLDNSPTGTRAALAEPLQSLLAALHERHLRFRVAGEGAWELGPKAAATVADAEAGSAPALALLSQMPWTAPFAARVRVFRALVAADKVRVRGGHGTPVSPYTASELHIVVRRGRLLHDGYAQLGHQPPQALRRVLRVKFVSELGMGEAGIDHNGVFKEFMEETVRAAFDANLGLFAQTPAKHFYANPNSGALHAEHEQLFEFVGRIIGKALYEGVTLDVPLATFFVRRVLGGANSIDELPSLDPQLHSSLLFVKGYEGDVADLELSFAIDEEHLGQRRTVDLRPGGSAVRVDHQNRIQYLHLVSDYHLNRQVSAQARALHRGLMGVLQPGWLRLFSAPEVVTLLAGDDVDIDVDDLRKHTVYHGGYHELSPTVRALWQVLKEFSNAERKAFLKFVTACSQPPLLGFKHLEPRFAVQCVSASGGDNGPLGGVMAMVGLTPAEKQRLPTAATCFNLLKLPDFRSKKLLKEKLLTAIHSNSGFELS